MSLQFSAVKFPRDSSVCQKLLKSVNFHRVIQNVKRDGRFFETQCAYRIMNALNSAC